MMKKIASSAVTATLIGVSSTADAHHSFAMYDGSQTLVLTGVMYRFVAQAAHAELHLYLIGPDGKLEKDAEGRNVSYGIEMAGAAQVAKEGITAAGFPAGTIFSVKVNPMRNGSKFGARLQGSAIAKCPWKTPPAPGKSCDSVKGAELIGGKTF